MSPTVWAWLEGLCVAVIIAVATVVAGVITHAQVSNTPVDYGTMASMALVAGIGGLASYLKRSPLPGRTIPDSETEETRGE